MLDTSTATSTRRDAHVIHVERAKLFFPFSLRGRLIAVVIAIDIFAAALTGSVIVLTARSATKLEIEASTRLAEVLVTDTIRIMQDVPSDIVLKTIDLNFRNVRHVRIAVLDARGTPVHATTSLDAQRDRAERAAGAPAWFARAIAPVPSMKVFPLLVHNRREGDVTVAAEPADEIGEAWQYAGAILATGLCLNLVVFIALFVLFGRALRPLTALVGGLADLERRNYAVRLARPSLPELAIIADHFNRAAGTLSLAYDANRTLNRKLLTAQDDERRRTALELHDEVGPCLFALDVEASSIVTAADKLEDHRAIRRRAEAVVALTKTVQSLNRRLLDRMRPMSLGRVPLEDCLLRLVVDFDGANQVAIDPAIGPIAESYGSLVDLTIYRCVQEGLFNAVRHAKAKRIELGVREDSIAKRIDIRIGDDGHGLAAPTKPGLGLAGMHERIEALEGRFELASSSAGTTLTISLPIEDLANARVDRTPS